MMKRKLCALLLAGAMLLSLAACGTSAANPSGGGADGGGADGGGSQASGAAPAADPTQTGTAVTAGSQTIKLTLEGDEGTREVTAALMDTPAAAEFAAHLPLSFHMTDYAGREKHAHMDFSIAAGREVIARMDQDGIDALGSYQTDVDVQVALADR